MENIYYDNIFCGSSTILSDLIITDPQIETYIYDLKNTINKLEFNNIQTLSYYKQLTTNIKTKNKYLKNIIFHNPKKYHINDVLKFCGFNLEEPYIHLLTYDNINNKISISINIINHLKNIHYYIYNSLPYRNKKQKLI